MSITIGILGGMGTYATINCFKQYAEVFPAEKEFERPRIIIDNRCTMPSRVRAMLYGEAVDKLVEEMTDSIQSLICSGGENIKVILACNTSHLFLSRVFERLPEAKEHVVSMIDACVERICADGVRSIYLLGTEATISFRIYQQALEKHGVFCEAPAENEYEKIRACIEAVKQNKYSKDVESIFLELMQRRDTYILGCTELPVLYEMYKDQIDAKIYDPCLITLEKIKKEYSNE